jgi:tRNA threonylcarbamoyladenosine biosynthesis protein TsaE
VIFWHAEFAELYEARSDEKFVFDKFCDFSVFCVKQKKRIFAGKYIAMNSKEFHINSVEALTEVSEYLISLRDKADIIAFYGAMGAGKTTLIKNLCHRMDVTDEVNSPTFAIVNEYVTGEGESVYHFDFYRIKKLEEAYDIGFENYFDSGNLCLIEWPEMIEPLLPENYIRVEIQHGETDDIRIIKCELIND